MQTTTCQEIMNQSYYLQPQQQPPPPPPPPIPFVLMGQMSHPHFSTMMVPNIATFNNVNGHVSPPTSGGVKQTWQEFCMEMQARQGVCQSGMVPSVIAAECFQPPQPNIHSTYNWWPTTRRRPDPSDEQSKSSKKRKKPLSQTAPTKREWPIEDAERALVIEKDCNRRSKNALIIKFPDLELNRDIVSAYHPDIESVHFQQPSTPRFCFVTLKASANTDEVMKSLSRYKFGNGYLTVEHKKDREEDQSLTAKDLDPFTLYVGNLAQEITKEDMLRLYPKSKRIDIGYAKKMKFTRYAFVGFHTIDDAINAFQRTHNHQIYNKSLIVRFRRLHGTVGMPGETKLQNSPKLQAPPDKPPAPPTSSDDTDVLGHVNEHVIPFTIRVKEEQQAYNEYDEDYNVHYEVSESCSTHVPKSIKLEVKCEDRPETYNHGSHSQLLIKTEPKREQFIEPEFNEYSDPELDTDDYYTDEHEFEHMYRTLTTHQKHATRLKSNVL